MLLYGFESFEKICGYLGTKELDYDIVLLDIDSDENFKEFDMGEAEKNFFVTAFDSYSLKKGLDIIGQLTQKVSMTKVLFSRDILKEDDDYLNFLSFYFSIMWEEEKIYFPYEQGDNTAIMENQRISQIRLKNLSQQYRDSLMLIAGLIIPDTKGGDLKKALKKIL